MFPALRRHLPAGPGGGTLAACCAAHVVHDGLSALLYVLLPLWQSALGLSLSDAGLLRALYSGVFAGFQAPAGFLGERLGERAVMAAGTALAGAGFLLVGLWGGLGVAALIPALAVAGLGAATQHPLGSSLTARAFEGTGQRAALATYNFAGDIGKMAVPALAALLIAVTGWADTCAILGVLALAAALGVMLAVPPLSAPHPATSGERRVTEEPALPAPLARQGMIALSAIGVVDSAARAGFLTFLPFLLAARGISVPLIGAALTAVFLGGAGGKFVCGVLANRVGVLRTVLITEIATGLGIAALLMAPLPVILALLVPLGAVLNGTSSVLYCTVAELVPTERRARAFAFFYTVTIGASALSPALFGLIGDAAGIDRTMALTATLVLAVLPLTLPLRPVLAARRG